MIESKGNVNFAACKDPALTVKYLQYCLAQFLIDVFSQCKAIAEVYEFMNSSMTFLLTPEPPPLFLLMAEETRHAATFDHPTGLKDP